ncbi:MAG: methyltransferase domain-containing protein [Patescibacteria group bacterium]
MIVSYLHKILTENSIKKVLDLGAGHATEALYCASFGADVDWVDKKEVPSYLKDHPRINAIQTKIEDFNFNNKYDLIIIKFVLHFLDKNFIIHSLFPNIIKSLNNNGFLVITSFGEKDKIFSLPDRSVFFSKEEMEKCVSPLNLITYNEYDEKDSHPPLGEHTHSIQEFLFKK